MQQPKNNREFLEAIFGTDISQVWVGEAHTFKGGFAPALVDRLDPNVSNYFAASTLKPGSVSRTNEAFYEARVVVLDDVGTKMDLDFAETFGLRPTYKIETSPGNFQWGYVLEDGEPDALKWNAFIEGWKKSPHWAGSSDGTGLCPYKRMPWGKSHKEHCKGFETKLVEWNGGVRYGLDALAVMLGVDLSPDAVARARMPAPALRALGAGEEQNDPIYKMFDVLGHVKAGPDASGWFDVTCLWAPEHTGGADSGSAYHPGGAYKCHHSHCADKGLWAVSDKLWNWDGDTSAGDVRRMYRELVFPALPDEKSDLLLTEIMETHEALVEVSLLAQLRAARDNYACYDEGVGFRAVTIGSAHTATALPPVVLRGVRRGQVTLLAAVPGAGKSVLSIQMALAVVHEKPELVGQKSVDWVGDVVLVSNEEGLDEIHRRIEACEKFFGLDPRDRKWSIHAVPGPGITLVEKVGSKGGGSVVRPKCAELMRYLIDARKTRDVGLIVLDTLSSMVVGLDENSNGDMQRVMDFTTHLARAAFSGVVLVHHVSKGGAGQGEASMFSARGASSIVGAVRSGLQLSKPYPEDLDAFGWSEARAANVVRLDSTKASHSAKGSGALGFFEWVSVPVDCFDPRQQAPGAMIPVSVGVLKPITPTPVVQDVAQLREHYELVKEAIDAGETVKITNRSSAPGVSLPELWGVREGAAKRILEALEGMGLLRRGQHWSGNRNPVPIVELADVAANNPAGEDFPF